MGHPRDLTERKDTEALLSRQQKRMLHSAKMTALGEMAAGMAHEINNPLTVISVQAQCLQLMVDGGKLDRAALGAAVRKIDQTIDRIARIVRGLRSFARDGSHDPFERVQLHRVIAETIDFCRVRFQNNAVELRIGAISPELEIDARPVQVSEILLNLLNNAFDAVEGRSERWVEVSTAVDGDWWELRVRDSGVGVPEENRDRIMQPFFTTKGIGKGTGLGLSLSRGIAESHGGRLFLNLKAQQTEFVLRLPIRQTDTHSKEIAA
jgi:C4-dicarboxylate-specific signal transduction histidine kinase